MIQNGEGVSTIRKEELLKRYFGHTAFRPGQEPLIDALLQGWDVLGVMPTGAGKSCATRFPRCSYLGLLWSFRLLFL